MTEEEQLEKQEQLKGKMHEWLVKQESADTKQWLDTYALLSQFLNESINYGRVARALSLKNEFYVKKEFSYGQYMIAHFEDMNMSPTVMLSIVLDGNYSVNPGVPLIEFPKISGTLDIEHPRRGRRAREAYDWLGDVPMDIRPFV